MDLFSYFRVRIFIACELNLNALTCEFLSKAGGEQYCTPKRTEWLAGSSPHSGVPKTLMSMYNPGSKVLGYSFFG